MKPRRFAWQFLTDCSCRCAAHCRWNQDGNGSPNYEMDERTFLLNRERAVDYLNMLDRLYVFDGYAGWDPEVRPASYPCLVICYLRPRFLLARPA